MGQNRIPSEKIKRRILWIGAAIGLILLAAACINIIRQRYAPAMEDIYFLAFETQKDRSMEETVIYKYDADTEKVYELGKVTGYFHNCKLDSEKKYITGVRSPWSPGRYDDEGSGFESGIVRYSVEDGTSELLRSEQQMSIGKTESIVWDYSYPFDNGEKMLMCYENQDRELHYLLYELETKKAKKIDLPERNRGVYDIRNTNIWYSIRNRVMQYNVKTKAIKEVLKRASQFTISDDGTKASYFLRNDVKRIYLYDTVRDKKICTLRAGWNRTFGITFPYSCGWDQNGNYFYYMEHFNKFFNSSDVRIKVYNFYTKSSKCIYLERNRPSGKTYEFIRNAD